MKHYLETSIGKFPVPLTWQIRPWLVGRQCWIPTCFVASLRYRWIHGYWPLCSAPAHYRQRGSSDLFSLLVILAMMFFVAYALVFLPFWTLESSITKALEVLR